MIERDDEQQAALKREALAWLAWIGLGNASTDDLAALRRWRDTSPAHASALAQAGRLWRDLEAPVAALVRDGGAPVLAPRRAYRPSRRALIGGGAAAMAAAAACITVLGPPLHLWPSLAELSADYRTQTGEQRHVAVADAVSIELNTRTSIGVRTADGASAIELIAGETVVAVTPAAMKPFTVVAAGGSMTTQQATFNVRRDGVVVCLTCMDGHVTVERDRRALTLGPAQQVTYDGRGLGPIVAADPATVTAWREGMLVFRNTPLAAVIDEVNRYRPGRIILLDTALGQRLVSARFEISRLETVMEQIGQVFKAPVRALPGGLVTVG